MESQEGIKSLLLAAGSESYPPVHKWNPPLSGEIDIVIKANGDWYHEGIKFVRQPLVKLFASIIKKEGEDYYLVSPVEKWKIAVEDAPLLITAVEIVENLQDERLQIIKFKTFTDDIFCLDTLHALRFSDKKNVVDIKPYVMVRDNLEALLTRNVFYQLTEMVKLHEDKYGVWSCGSFFPLE